MYRGLLVLLVCANAFLSLAQKQRAIGTWRSYFSYYNAHQVEKTPDKIYAAADFSILYVDKDDNSIHAIDKSSGLSDVGVRKIKYNSSTKALFIAYQNSNIDLLKDDGQLYNIPDIKLSSTTSSKSINDAFMKGSLAYLATDLGVAVLDMQRREIRETYVIGASGNNVIINGITATSNMLFAATAEGVKSASLTNGNLQDYNQWTLHTNGIAATNTKLIASLENTVFVGASDSVILRYDGSQWTQVFARSGWELENFKVENGNLYAFFNTGSQYIVVTLNETTVLAETHFQGATGPVDIAVEGNIWIADKAVGLLRYNDTASAPEKYSLNSPATYQVFDMASADNVLYLAAGGTNLGYNSPKFNADGAQFWRDQWWWQFMPYNDAQNSLCLDYISVAVNQLTNKAYYASYQSGLTEVDLNTMTTKVYNQNNSPLEEAPSMSNFHWVQIFAVCTDHNGNTWMATRSSVPKLVCLKPDGTWKSFSLPTSVELTRKMIAVDGKIWLCNKGVGNLDNIVVYDPGYDLDDATDDSYRVIGTGVGNGNLPVSTVWSIVEDKDGYVWVGTDVGIATYYCPYSLPQQMCDADWIKVDQGGFIGYLFSTESVRAIAVDGANRKWVGTTNGVWLISADGKETLLRFTKDNSALPSNTIQSICVNQQNGEVFIGTDQGLVGYQGDATMGEDDKPGKVLVYPNPVRPDYAGVIAVRGLVDDAYIKITDAAGNLVFQGRANGSTAVWDGKGYKGERVKSGVYFVYSDTDEGKGKAVAKIVLLN